MFVFGVIAIEVWHTDFPVWGLILALSVCMFCITASFCAFFPRLTFAVYFSLRVYRPYWCDPSHYEPASWAECHYGADNRIRPPWPSACDDDVQDMGLYYHDAGAEFYSRFQAGPLHEGRASPDVLLPGRRYHCCWHRAARRAIVDVLQYRGLLLRGSKRRLHLPIDHRIWYRINYCEFCRVATYFLISVAQCLLSML